VTELETALHDVDNMAVRMVNLQESERQRYAAELHDSTVQHLTAASLNLMVLRGRSDSSDEDGLLGTIENSVAEAQREIRSVSYLLYPRALDEDGLTSTLSRFSSGFASRTKIASFVRTFGPLDSLPLPLQRAALRIVQEAMANVHRHAGAMAVRIRVAVGEGRLSISVADNGKGMSVDAEGNVLHPGIGIAGMKARAHHFGGSLRIRSSIGRGTIILLRIPVQIRPSVISDKQQSRDVRRHRRPSVAGLANLGVFPIILRVFANLA
jgi:signal transduction histidine kinase